MLRSASIGSMVWLITAWITASRDPKWYCTAERLRASVGAILHDPAYQAGAAKVMASHRCYEAAPLAASLLERLATTNRPVLRPVASDPWAG